MSPMIPDAVVYAAVNDVFEKASAESRHEIFIELRKSYNTENRFHHTYGRLAQNIARANATQWDNRPAALAAILFEKMTLPTGQAANLKTASDMLYAYGRQDLIEGANALLAGQNDRPDAQKFADIRTGTIDVPAAVNMVAEYIYAGDFSGMSVAGHFAQVTGASSDTIMKKASAKVESAKTLKRDDSFPFVSGLHAKIA